MLAKYTIAIDLIFNMQLLHAEHAHVLARAWKGVEFKLTFAIKVPDRKIDQELLKKSVTYNLEIR